jgi:hypothetical protein
LSFTSGEAASSLAVVAVGADGEVRVHNPGATAVSVTVDVSGWSQPADLSTAQMAPVGLPTSWM